MNLTTNFPPAARDLPILLCLSHLRWDSVFQRPQHLMRHAAETFRVVFWEEPVEVPPGPDLPRLATRLSPEGVLVVTPWQARDGDVTAATARQVQLLDGLLDALGGELGVVWYYTSMMLPLASHLRPGRVVYDCMDELSAFQGASPQLLLQERRLLRHCDLVFTGGRSLHAAKQPLHSDAHLFPSSVDAGHFGQARSGLAEPDDQVALPRPRIGFHGVIDERMDLDLLAGLAGLRPDWHFVMVGPIVKIDPGSVPRPRNIHWLGARPYAALPAFLSGWDAGFMPFALNDATRFISPTKTPEFLAAGVPVVSTPVADVVHDWGRDGLVEIAGTAEAMEAALARVMARSAAPWLALVNRRLQRMSWTATWARMLGLIHGGEQMEARAAAATVQHV